MYRSGGVGIVGVLCACILGSSTPAQAQLPPERWQSYVLAPSVAFRKPAAVVRIEGSVTNPEALISGDGTTTLTYVEGQPPPVVVYDFGQNIGGFPRFDVTAFTGTPTLRASFSETLAGLSADGDYAGKTRLVRVQEHPVTQNGTIRSRVIEGAQRYKRITLSTPGTVTLSRTGIDFSAFRGTPKALRGHFLSSDPLLNRIWYAGIYTVNLNQVTPGLRPLPEQLAKRRVLVDGAKRDRRIWSGDLLTAAPTVYYALDPRYIRGSLEVIASHPINDSGSVIARDYAQIAEPGPLPGVCSPNQVGGNGCRFYSAAYSMAFVIALHEYYRYTGDRAFVKRMWPAVARQMAWNARLIGDAGMMRVDDRTGATWNLETFTGDLTYVNAVYHQALRDAASLAEAIGDKQAKDFRSRARRIKVAVNANLFNRGRGIYDLSTTDRGPVVQDGNVWAVLSGIASDRQSKKILKVLRRVLDSPYGALNVSQPFPESFRPVVSPYMGGFQLRAYFDHGFVRAALGMMRTEWGWMIDHDPSNTVWERILPDGRLTHRASAAHAWSTSPTWILSQYVLGAAPAQPGWTTWRVKPHPGDLGWARGRVPTPKGPLGIEWDENPRSFELTVRAPKGTRGSVWVPLRGARRRVEVDGRAVKARRVGDYAVVRNQSGTHTYGWSARRRRG